jgi:hypothetical protein
MNCPKCKTYVSPEYDFCLNCGFNVSREAETLLRPAKQKPVAKSTKNALKDFSIYLGAILITVLIILGVLAGLKDFEFNPQTSPGIVNQTNQNVAPALADLEAAPSPVALTPKPKKTKAPVEEKPVEFASNSNSVNQNSNLNKIVDETFPVEAGQFRYYSFAFPVTSNVIGSFEAKGGRNDIDVIILHAGEFKNFQNNAGFRSYYRSGYVASGNINLTLPPGMYYVIFSNSAALLTNKVVTANVGSARAGSN